jgi:hypothetical protein
MQAHDHVGARHNFGLVPSFTVYQSRPRGKSSVHKPAQYLASVFDPTNVASPAKAGSLSDACVRVRVE